ncbi:MAG: ferritin-like domain-containing protein, partial [Aquabacterium commune]|uniref:Dps family protein n=1 Tax=Aquabacterium commune TaxID=70586 RepID=UPI003BB09C48
MAKNDKKPADKTADKAAAKAVTKPASKSAAKPANKLATKPANKGTAIDIGIAASDRAAIAKGLNGLLADTFTLYLTTHNFHWNVTGPMFNTLHTMFMAQYTELWNA